MDLRKLHHMVVLSEELNFAKAANKVHLTQSALSRSIQNLEEELGGKLFDRNLHGVALTVIGRQVVSRARELLLQARNLQYEITLMQQSELGNVKLGAGPFPGATFLPPILADLAREHPRLCVEAEINNTEYLLQHLHAEEIEFFVADVRSIPNDAKLSIQLLARQFGAFFCHPAHPLFSKPIEHVAEVLVYPMLTVHMPDGIKAEMKRFLGLTETQELNFNLICNNPAVLDYVAQHSNAILISTFAVVGDDLAAGRLKPLTIPNQPTLFAEMGIVRLAGRSLSPTAEWLVTRMRHYADQLAEQFSLENIGRWWPKA
jgi:DNA-binding transcriptional LysR family regulator